MYGIKEQEWGYRLEFGGNVQPGEMKQWLRESERIFADKQGEFLVFVDMRTLIPLDRESQETMQEGQKLYRTSGMVRSVVILSSPVVAAQFRRLAGETGIAQWERYVDASTVPNWEEVGMNWLLNAVDPDHDMTADRSVSQRV
jgi:hypothetical protein